MSALENCTVFVKHAIKLVYVNNSPFFLVIISWRPNWSKLTKMINDIRNEKLEQLYRKSARCMFLINFVCELHNLGEIYLSHTIQNTTLFVWNFIQYNQKFEFILENVVALSAVYYIPTKQNLLIRMVASLDSMVR